MSVAPETDDLSRPQTLMRVPMGLASPLWGLFAGVAVSGATWWWMTRWARAENLEAIFGAAAKFEAAMDTEAATAEAPVVEATEAPIQVAEPMVEAAPETIAAVAVEPVVEPAPEPALEVAPEPTEDPAPRAVFEDPAEASPHVQPAVAVAATAEVLAAAAAEPAAVLRAKKKAAAPKAD
ncbi:MAG TPA: hypothetical protein VFE10_02140 [Phenylobacterium sp.]|nr:hypothetical protein [Phenylobacterium sp.]